MPFVGSLERVWADSLDHSARSQSLGICTTLVAVGLEFGPNVLGPGLKNTDLIWNPNGYGRPIQKIVQRKIGAKIDRFFRIGEGSEPKTASPQLLPRRLKKWFFQTKCSKKSWSRWGPKKDFEHARKEKTKERKSKKWKKNVKKWMKQIKGSVNTSGETRRKWKNEKWRKMKNMKKHGETKRKMKNNEEKKILKKNEKWRKMTKHKESWRKWGKRKKNIEKWRKRKKINKKWKFWKNQEKSRKIKKQKQKWRKMKQKKNDENWRTMKKMFNDSKKNKEKWRKWRNVASDAKSSTISWGLPLLLKLFFNEILDDFHVFRSECVSFPKKINNQFWEVTVFLEKVTLFIERGTKTPILPTKLDVKISLRSDTLTIIAQILFALWHDRRQRSFNTTTWWWREMCKTIWDLRRHSSQCGFVCAHEKAEQLRTTENKRACASICKWRFGILLYTIVDLLTSAISSTISVRLEFSWSAPVLQIFQRVPNTVVEASSVRASQPRCSSHGSFHGVTQIGNALHWTEYNKRRITCLI